MAALSDNNLAFAYERAAALGPFDAESFVKGLEALGDTVKATIERDGRQGYYNVNPGGVRNAVVRLTLEIWNSRDPENTNAVIRYLIDSGRVEMDTGPVAH